MSAMIAQNFSFRTWWLCCKEALKNPGGETMCVGVRLNSPLGALASNQSSSINEQKGLKVKSTPAIKSSRRDPRDHE